MKISNVSTSFNNKIQKNNTNLTTKKISNNPIRENLLMPTSAYYLSFLGYSKDLSKVAKNLKPQDCPPDIYSNIQNVIAQNNPDNKALCDVHFDKYKNVLNCYTLDDLKSNFPEFNKVISAYDVVAREDSVVGDFLDGTSEIFTSEEDLTLQLIKLYWGYGFSLNDLSDYFALNSSANEDKNLRYAMHNKLNIPLMLPKYAQVLKLSNEEYAKQLTDKIAQKKKETIEAKEQKAQGEPVVIPKHLSEAHKKHISKSLIEYYKNNPNAIYEKTQRQKEFFAQNPELAEDMFIAMNYAWNKTQEGRSIKKQLTRFMKKHGNIPDKELSTGDITTSQQNILKLFWENNSWAKEKFSKAVRLGYEFLQKISSDREESAIEKLQYYTIPQKQLVFSTIPTQYREYMMNWMKKNNYNPRDYIICLGIARYKESKEDSKLAKEIEIKSNEIRKKFEKYIDSRTLDAIATARQIAFINIISDLYTNPSILPVSLRRNGFNFELFKKEAYKIIQSITYEKSGYIYPIIGIEQETLNMVQSKLVQASMRFDVEEFAQCIEQYTDKEFEKIIAERNIKLD